MHSWSAVVSSMERIKNAVMVSKGVEGLLQTNANALSPFRAISILSMADPSFQTVALICPNVVLELHRVLSQADSWGKKGREKIKTIYRDARIIHHLSIMYHWA
ncbi:hypothetical protein BSKO_03940 [Bryopsis sp. KO-2023]|nr:hypothetical protein BSKO_03940 [Bryopsis sp. KO-2023]